MVTRPAVCVEQSHVFCCAGGQDARTLFQCRVLDGGYPGYRR
jgi:hypothetical protein